MVHHIYLTFLLIGSFRSIIHTLMVAKMSYKIRTIFFLLIIANQAGEKTNNSLLTNATNQINK